MLTVPICRTTKGINKARVVIESSETESENQDISSRSGNDADADNADIRPIYDEALMAECEPMLIQSTADDSKPKPRSSNHSSRSLPVSKSSCVTKTVVPIADHSKNSNSFSDSKYFICSTCHKCVFNANHDACITNFLKEVNSRAKVQSNKTRNSNKLVEQNTVPYTVNLVRQIFIGHRFSPNKTSTMYEKTSPRSDLRWKPTGRIFNTAGLRWVSTGKMLASCTRKDDTELTHGSNVDIPNIYECKQTLDLSAGTSINVQKEQSFDFSAGTKQENLRVWLLKKLISQKPVSQWIHK
ncbi:hypothetical protein Tco_0754323 [Tanacetum coccineum]